MAEKPKSKRQLRDEVINALYNRTATNYQKCPYTCVVVDATYGDNRYRGIGFSKVSWPDSYEWRNGYALAETRALKHIANQVIAEEFDA